MLEINSVSYGYTNASNEKKNILSDVTARLNPGTCVALLGSNGSGKSTLLRCINGELMPDRGQVILDGKSIDSHPMHVRAGRIATIQQDPGKGSAGEMTVLENMRIASLRRHAHLPVSGMNSPFRKRAGEILQESGLQVPALADRLASDLSGGQRQMLALAMAMVAEPAYILMDEPGAALDPRASATLCSISRMLAKKRKVGILMVTHNYTEALSFADEVWLLKEGTICEIIPKSDTERFQAIYFLERLELGYNS